MQSRRVLLVEGDDEHVVDHLCWSHGINYRSHFIIKRPESAEDASEGIDSLLRQIPTYLQTDIDRLAMIVDADTGAEQRWEGIRRQLEAAGFSAIPRTPAARGTVLELDRATRTIRFGAWIMPDNAQPGMLEDFLARLVPATDKMLPHVDRFLNGIPEVDRLFSPVHRPKARIHAFLAVQEAPGKPFGTAIRAGFLDPSRAEIVAPFLEWLRQVLIE